MQVVLNVKQVTKVYNQFMKHWEQLERVDSVKFAELTKLYCGGVINKVPLEHIPFYVDEFYTKVAAMYDIVDTLEFGKLRTETQKDIHSAYISTSLRGAFLASAYDGEKDIPLSHCSHEGLVVHLKLIKVGNFSCLSNNRLIKTVFKLQNDLERNNENPSDELFVKAMDQIETMENGIGNASIEINRYRLQLVSNTRDSLASALHMSQGRRFRLSLGTYYMDGNYGINEGYKCEYYKKSSGKELEVNYKTFLWSALETAHSLGRDIMVEIRGSIISAPVGYSHDNLLDSYFADIASVEAEKLEKQKVAEERKEQTRAQKGKSKAILNARKKAESALTDPADILALEEEAAAMDVLVKSLVGGVRLPGDSSDENDDEDDEDEDDDGGGKSEVVSEGETEPQLEVVVATRQKNPDNGATSSSHTSSKHNKTGPSPRCEKNKGSSRSSSAKHKTSYKILSKCHEKTKNDRTGSLKSKSRDTLNSHNASRLSGGRRRSHKRHTNHSTTDYSSTDSEMEEQSDCDETQQQVAFEIHSGGHSSRDFRSNVPTLLQQLEGQANSPVHKNRKTNKTAKKVTVNKTLDFNTVGEFDPSFPELDGHPLENSLLHDIDETLVRPLFNNNSDSEAEMEMEYENHRSNVVASSSCDSRGSGRKRSKRAADPEKLKRRADVALAAEMRRNKKLAEAKVKRDQAVFQRRVLEANNGRSAAATGTPDDKVDGKLRKRRVTSGLSEAWSGFYGRDMVINQQYTQPLNRELIIGCADIVLGNAPPHINADEDPDYAAVLSYRQQSGAVCDRVLKQKLMKHLQLDIFKEITFERLITEYSVAKRASVGVADDEIIDIDWFQVMGGFADNLKSRFVFVFISTGLELF
jgi:hypothetical protein